MLNYSTVTWTGYLRLYEHVSTLVVTLSYYLYRQWRFSKDYRETLKRERGGGGKCPLLTR